VRGKELAPTRPVGPQPLVVGLKTGLGRPFSPLGQDQGHASVAATRISSSRTVAARKLPRPHPLSLML
jgi:hypothetical protein